MASEGDAKENESDRSGSEFGPPLGEFGPPVSEFGPPAGTDTGVGWQAPHRPTDHPELAWRPADDATSAPGSQYRAPDSGAHTDDSTAPPSPGREQPATETGLPQAAGGERELWWNHPTTEGGVPKPPEPSEPGLSWAEDPIAKRLAPTGPAAPVSVRRAGSSSLSVLLGAGAVVVAVIALIVTIVATRGDSDTSAESRAGGAAAASRCESDTDGAVTVGNGPGDVSSGAGAILGFQHAFYVERSGERARRFVAPDATNISSAEVIQKGIDEQVAVGTEHCLTITELTSDTFGVVLTEYRPDGTKQEYSQMVTTVSRNGKVLVQQIDVG
ncbi:hypothetical protein [Nocardia sp. CNY236]|uniref:hypothetical protein n=1 Tax=Nocardia sp. CNY236 TaxID=1169152 RepID=UPI00042663C7|nr:hypothetical protein [Nocardia sp. CNY236]